jgi:ankyrin repeat protein
VSPHRLTNTLDKSDTFTGHAAVVATLLAAGADVNRTVRVRRATALHAAATLGRPQIVQQLVDAGADVHAADKVGDTALLAIFALERSLSAKHVEVVKALLANGANVAATDWEGDAALMCIPKPLMTERIRNSNLSKLKLIYHININIIIT